jgi:hypothetical protein
MHSLIENEYKIFRKMNFMLEKLLKLVLLMSYLSFAELDKRPELDRVHIRHMFHCRNVRVGGTLYNLSVESRHDSPGRDYCYT